MKGYYRNQAATDEVLKDGWFHSGDLGRFDDKGNLFITGREKEVIVLPSGKNIYPDELETHYLQTPYIQEIAVIGVSNSQERGDRLHAVVVPNFEYLKAKRIANARGLSETRSRACRISCQSTAPDELPGAGRATSENGRRERSRESNQAARRKRAAAERKRCPAAWVKTRQ